MYIILSLTSSFLPPQLIYSYSHISDLTKHGQVTTVHHFMFILHSQVLTRLCKAPACLSTGLLSSHNGLTDQHNCVLQNCVHATCLCKGLTNDHTSQSFNFGRNFLLGNACVESVWLTDKRSPTPVTHTHTSHLTNARHCTVSEPGGDHRGKLDHSSPHIGRQWTIMVDMMSEPCSTL